jgi:chromosome segregation ATPase
MAWGIWGAVIGVIGMFAVLAQLLMSYQKRAHQFRLRQAPLRKRVGTHNEKMAKAGEQVQTLVQEKVAGLEAEHQQHEVWIEHMRSMLDTVNGALMDREEEERIQDMRVESKKEKEERADWHQKIKEARTHIEQATTYLNGMGTDLQIAKHTLGLLNARVPERKEEP